MLHSQVAQNVAGQDSGGLSVVSSTGLAQDNPMNDQIFVEGPKEFDVKNIISNTMEVRHLCHQLLTHTFG